MFLKLDHTFLLNHPRFSLLSSNTTQILQNFDLTLPIAKKLSLSYTFPKPSNYHLLVSPRFHQLKLFCSQQERLINIERFQSEYPLPSNFIETSFMRGLSEGCKKYGEVGSCDESTVCAVCTICVATFMSYQRRQMKILRNEIKPVKSAQNC